MFKSLYEKARNGLFDWLIHEPPVDEIMPYDFNRLKYEIKPGDVLLFEGRSRVSQVIRTISLSPWTHAGLYIGRLNDIESEEAEQLLRKQIGNEQLEIKDNTRLIIEDLMDRGTVVTPLHSYRHHHIRICRPAGISPTDLQSVIFYMIKALGQPYNIRHLLDLTRFLLPWTLLPRRWGSSLFRTSSGEPESGICSSHIAEAFSSVQFPVLPFIKSDEEQGVEIFQRNPHLFSPKDFDFSPYFEIIKYPLFNPNEPLPYYRRMPWTKSGFLHQDHGILNAPIDKKKKKSKNAIEKKTNDNPDETPTNKNPDDTN